MIMMTMAMIKMMMVMSKGIVAQLEEGSLVVQLAARCYSWGLIMLRIKMIVIMMLLITTMFAIKMIIDDTIASDQHDPDACDQDDPDVCDQDDH